MYLILKVIFEKNGKHNIMTCLRIVYIYNSNDMISLVRCPDFLLNSSKSLLIQMVSPAVLKTKFITKYPNVQYNTITSNQFHIIKGNQGYT